MAYIFLYLIYFHFRFYNNKFKSIVFSYTKIAIFDSFMIKFLKKKMYSIFKYLRFIIFWTKKNFNQNQITHVRSLKRFKRKFPLTDGNMINSTLSLMRTHYDILFQFCFYREKVFHLPSDVMKIFASTNRKNFIKKSAKTKQKRICFTDIDFHVIKNCNNASRIIYRSEIFSFFVYFIIDMNEFLFNFVWSLQINNSNRIKL